MTEAARSSAGEAHVAGADAKPEAGRTWAVAIVHGIGNSEPIGLISDVVKALQSARPGLDIDPYTRSYDKARLGMIKKQTKQDREAERKERLIEPAQHSRKGRLAGAEVRFATAFWSDISFSKDGLLNLLGGMVLSGFGVRYLADAATDRGGIFFWITRLVLRLMVKVLAFFIFPVTLFSLIFSLMGLLAFYMIRITGLELGTVPRIQAVVIAASSLFISWRLAQFGLTSAWPLRKERTLMVPIFLVFRAIAIFFAGLVLVLTFFDPGPLRGFMERYLVNLGQLFGHEGWSKRIQALDEIGLCFGLLQWLQLWGGIAMIGLTGLIVALVGPYVIVPIAPRERRQSLLLASTSVISLWILIMLMFWPENLVTYAAMSLYQGSNVASVTAMVFDWGEWRFKPTLLKDPSRSYLMVWFEVVFLLLVTALAIVTAGLLVWRRRVVRALSGLSADDLARSSDKLRSNKPRLIAPMPYIVVVWFFMFLIAVIGLLQLIQLIMGQQSQPWLVSIIRSASDNLVHELAVPAELVRIGAAAGLAYFALVAHTIRSSMKLILDVCNHFAAPNQEVSFPVRRRIERRLRDTFDYLLREGDRPHLLVIGHSQGTMIALEELFGSAGHAGRWTEDHVEKDPGHVPEGQTERRTGKLSDRVESLTILTFGSPLTHVYQHYFAHHYPMLARMELPGTKLAEIAKDKRIRWVNAYRIDDYVGTYIDSSIPNFPINVPLPVGGHTDYWRPEVFQQLLAMPELAHVLAPQPAARA